MSCGFDAALGDPLGNYCVTPAGYGHMTRLLTGLAGGKVVVVLEVCCTLLCCHVSMLSISILVACYDDVCDDKVLKLAIPVTGIGASVFYFNQLYAINAYMHRTTFSL